MQSKPQHAARTKHMYESNFGVSVPGVVVINSKSRGGKSHLIHHMVYANRNEIDYIVEFSRTGHNPENLTFVNRKYKHPTYISEKMKKLIEKQKQYVREGKNIVACVIIDDCISSKKMWSDQYLIDAATQSYHLNIWLIISTQAINKVNNIIRENAFQVAIFHLDTKSAFNAAYDSYGQDHETLREFKNFVNRYTGEHKFLFKDKHGETGWRCLLCKPNKPEFYISNRGREYEQQQRESREREKRNEEPRKSLKSKRDQIDSPSKPSWKGNQTVEEKKTWFTPKQTKRESPNKNNIEGWFK